MKKYSLEELLPHRAPMILVNGVESYNFEEKTLVAGTQFDEQSIFYVPEQNGVPAYVGIELMAQTVGLLSGIFAREIENHAPRIGFLLGSRNYKNRIEKFELHQKYKITAQQIFFQDGFGKIICTIHDDAGTLAAEAELNVYLTQSDNFEAALALLNN